MPQEHHAILCPYCGHTQRKTERCEVCGGSFDSVSKRGIAVNMGPWFLHDQRVPFRPGFNYTSMKRLIASGKVTADSILRGPSTQQLWAPARLTPGVAHLLGFCPRCETPAAPDAVKCDNCAQPFREETAYNELGLPFENSAQARAAQEELDREVARCNGRSRSLRLWQHPDVPMLSLCPYCGDWQKSSDQCSTCGGVFDQLSQRATIIAMGPWFVRNKRFPYLPGCSYDVMRRQIEAKRIDASTIVRGPTTRQFWSVARNVPGISHLVGHCWSCGAAAGAADVRCAQCQSPFGKVDKQNALGLMFATEAEALAAEQELEAKFNPMMPPTPVALPPVPVSLQGPAALPKGMSSLSHAAAGEAAFSGLDRASLAVIAATVIVPDAEDEAINVATADEATFTTNGAARSVPVARPRRRGSRRSHPALVAGLALLLVAGVITAIVMLANSGKPPETEGDAPASPLARTNEIDPPSATVPGTNPSVETPAHGPVDVAMLREQAVHEWTLLRGTSRDGQVGLSLDNIADLMAAGESLFADGGAEASGPVFTQALREMEKLRPQIALRDEATAARNKAADLLITIDPTDLPEAGLMMIEETRMRFDEAQIHFDNADFARARDVWSSVAKGLVSFEERVTGLTTVQAAEAGYLAALDPDLDEEMLSLTAGDKWREIAQLIAQARQATADEEWDQAIEAYAKAADAAPPVMAIAKPLAVRYWACLAGQVTARAWHGHIDNTTLDPRQRGIMRHVFNRLRLPFGPIDQAMLSPISRDDLLKIILVDPASQLQATHGDVAVSTFQLGAHLISLSQLLSSESGKLDEKQEIEVTKRLLDLKESAQTAGFNAKMTAEIQKMTDVLADMREPANVTKARQVCDGLLNQLARADEAMDMMRE